VRARGGAPGLLDEVTILETKLTRISDPAKLANVRNELRALEWERAKAIAREAGVRELEAELRRVNEAPWDNEDRLRDFERARDYGPVSVECARAAYRTNDRRSAVKRQRNDLLGSELFEEKSYSKYE